MCIRDRLYIPFVIVAVLGTVNGVNLTDGLDGLSSGVTIIVIVFFTMCAYAAGNGVVIAGGAMIGGQMCIRDRVLTRCMFPSFFLRKYQMGRTEPTSWPIPVARAAPVTPSFKTAMNLSLIHI